MITVRVMNFGWSRGNTPRINIQHSEFVNLTQFDMARRQHKNSSLYLTGASQLDMKVETEQ